MSTFHLQIVTPDGSFYDGQAEKLIVPALKGEMCVLANHIPFVTSLTAGRAAVVTEDGQRRLAACSGGMVAVTKDVVRLVATTFEWADSIDVARAHRAKDEAQRRIKAAKNATDLELAKAKLSRALVRIKTASSN
ncbi:MAG: ATP synthase F1 subunit epsilon [Oscillospiraceae bacterium]|nr:ATP synthase F1 subunit epsilon [Oscillospiraceae bacterium]